MPAAASSSSNSVRAQPSATPTRAAKLLPATRVSGAARGPICRSAMLPGPTSTRSRAAARRCATRPLPAAMSVSPALDAAPIPAPSPCATAPARGNRRAHACPCSRPARAGNVSCSADCRCRRGAGSAIRFEAAGPIDVESRLFAARAAHAIGRSPRRGRSARLQYRLINPSMPAGGSRSNASVIQRAREGRPGLRYA
jgi:hypothetical protein